MNIRRTEAKLAAGIQTAEMMVRMGITHSVESYPRAAHSPLPRRRDNSVLASPKRIRDR